MMHGMKKRRSGSARTGRRLSLAWLVLVATILSFFAGTLQLASAQEQGAGQQVDPNNGQPVLTAQDDATQTPETGIAGAAQTEGTSRLEIHVVECPNEFEGTTGDEFFDACHANGLDNVNVRLTTLTIEEVVSQEQGQGRGGAMPTDYDQILQSKRVDNAGPGIAVFDTLPADDYTVVVDLPGATNNFYSYCSFADSDQEVAVTPNDENNGVVTLTDNQNVICDWYIIPDPEGRLQAQNEGGAQASATATAEVTTEEGTGGDVNAQQEETPVAAETREVTGPDDEGDVSTEEGSAIGGAAVGDAEITIDMRVCPADFVDPRSANYDTFAASCVDGANDVVLRLTDVATNNYTEQTTSTRLNNTFANLADGTYSMYSNIPGDSASEFLFCQPDGGSRYQKQFNENGVTTFNDLTGEQLFCSWYVVPEDSRGEETGASLTVHLAACPTDYAGNAYFDDCHANGIDDSEFVLSGPNNTQLSGTTSAPRTEGPGTVSFTGLGAGDYTLAGGPPGDFGSVVVYCSDQANGQNTRIPVQVSSTQASFAIADGQDLLCDWYYIPEDASGQPTETPEARAEILITLFNCEPRADGYAGWGFGDLDDTCTETLNDVPFRLGAEGAPLTANTGVSGEGAVRFYDLLPGDYTASPTLPDDLANVAVYCSINGSNNVYQKPLQNGSTTFVNVEGEKIGCSWFVAAPGEAPSGPSGSITVREYVCESDKAEIADWDKDCDPGATGSGYTLNSGDGAVSDQGTPNSNGVLVFTDLPDGFYNLKQNDGSWCRATAEHVDSSSRVIVNGGGNTDVYLYHCGGVKELPSTGAGPQTDKSGPGGISIEMWAITVALVFLVASVGALFWTQLQDRRSVKVESPTNASQPTVTENGLYKMRFR